MFKCIATLAQASIKCLIAGAHKPARESKNNAIFLVRDHAYIMGNDIVLVQMP